MAHDSSFPVLPAVIDAYLHALKDSGFGGDIHTDAATRLVNATDNSIYQVMPQAVLAPRTGEDITLILTVSAQEGFRDIRFTPRGGGTGTNGQSLNDCIIIDTSRHLSRIIGIDADARRVTVEPGVVLDTLNRALSPHGLFFPPHISPSKSATLGGMAATDACGKGSRLYGKTGDYILSMTCILSDGREINTAKYEDAALTALLLESRDAVRGSLPALPRGVSAYDLPRALNDAGRLSMTRLIAGSEGSLAVIKDITFRLLPRPAFKGMVAVMYADFLTALRDVSALLRFHPAAIETIDDRILDLARGDILWHEVRNILPPALDAKAVKAMHFVEFEGDTLADVTAHMNALLSALSTKSPAIGHYAMMDAKEIAAVSALRSKCVGLLGNMQGNRRPVPFIEDTAVPPENLAGYIAELKAMLAARGLECGMFGHSDAGCLHVRPALDLRMTEDRAFIRTLSDDVAALVKKHGGVLWGEHGKGMRGEYTSLLLGTPYYAAMQRVKAHLDPYNKLNPGKIAAPPGTDILKIDDATLRGEQDAQITPALAALFPKAVQCNGNGQCFSAMPDDTMCPSFKVTGDRRHSPKGRAALLREWMRLKNIDKSAAGAFEGAVFDALSGCLSCKACTSVCPIHVNIPDMKVEFLDAYYSSRRRPVRDYLIGLAESISAVSPALPLPVSDIFGLVDVPRAVRPSLHTLMKRHGFRYATALRVKKTARPILIVQDAYTSFYEPQLALSVLQFFRKIGLEPLVLPFKDSGKGWHVRGFKNRFRRIALRNIEHYELWAKALVPMVGIDPSLTLVYRDEYAKVLGHAPRFRIHLLQEWLGELLHHIPLPSVKAPGQKEFPLFLHCTEKTALPQSATQWAQVFGHFGLSVRVQEAGCCGMAGAYGHEEEHVMLSKNLYRLSWEGKMKDAALATGYSCRGQTARMEGFTPKHPIELLNDLL